jgi:hypothetical protein
MPVTKLGGKAADVQVVPLEVSTFPEVLGATNPTAEVPLPRITLLAVSVEAPVPPDATGRAEPRVNVAEWFIASTTFVPLL